MLRGKSAYRFLLAALIGGLLAGCERADSETGSALTPDSSCSGVACDATALSPGVVCDASTLPLYVDGDGDGVGAGEPACNGCFAGVAPAGYSYGSGDCDDSDAEATHLAYPDDDGDGWGVDDETRAVCDGETPPAGYAGRFRLGDCDDNDPERYPGTYEVFSDGIDTDCDGDDNPVTCGSDPDCGCAALERSHGTVEESVDCDGQIDLMLEVGEVCFCPGARVVALVANGGTAEIPSGAAIQLRVERDEQEDLLIDVTGPLGPGEFASPIVLPDSRGPTTLAIEVSGATDCNLANNQEILELPLYVDCIL